MLSRYIQKLNIKKPDIKKSDIKKPKVTLPVTGVVLAGALAGSLTLASLDGGGGDSADPDAPKLSANHAPEPSAEAESGPAEMPADCDPSGAADLDYANGRIPSEELCDLPEDGESLRADAAAAFYKLNAAYYERFGEDICVNSSYRSYDRQAELYESMPAGMAAAPGNSKHGLGIAADLCGGVEEDDTPQFEWLEDNSEKYGWIHPDWAYSNPYEPWHWEFDIGQDD